MNKKRKLVLGTIMPVSLVIVIAVSSIALTVVARHNNDDGSLSYNPYGGQVVLQLPEGIPPHPTTLRLTPFHVTRRGDYPLNGPNDVFGVYLWIPVLNNFLPVAVISDHSDPAHHDLLKEIYGGTPLWTPGIMENYFIFADEDLITWKRGDVFFANLTQGVHISLPFQLLVGSPLSALGDLSFDLPPMALEFRGIDHIYYFEGSGGTLPSGWSASSEGWRKPAWVQVRIPQWIGGNTLQFAGIQGVRGTITATPPP